jgi:DNA-binding PadR family transcriptional regulator
LAKSNDIASMKRTLLGEFEELVLLTIAVLEEQAYGVAITQELERQAERVVDFSTVHTTLRRLQEKGFLSSQMGGATAERGGRRKRLYALTTAGGQALQEVQRVRSRFWQQVPSKWQIQGV